ncbi:hypothetical protein QVD17_10587 [Tagetes erecta]|uniref:Polyprotein n=1 Tax=Tagetes erecta TaxID=13708 RepID=A0AAD8L2Q2_TARER|nr:hypothetical protein QVD17_10587 [Tagetes erecta]
MNNEKLKIPVFDGHYEHWSEMMQNLLLAKQLWNLIDPGIIEPAVGVAQSEAQKKTLADLRTKDLQVKHYLYQAIDRVTFEQILDRGTSKSVWDAMKQRFAGNDRVKKSMLQKLRRDFEVLEMKDSETIPEYFGRVLTVANQMRSNGETMPDVKIVEKILRTLTEKYLFVVVSIEESKDIEKMSIDELQSTLIVHEQKFKRPGKEEEQVLKVNYEENTNSGGRGRGRSNTRGRGRGRGRSFFNKETVECYKCHKLGHFQYECPMGKEANYVDFGEDEEMILMSQIDAKGAGHLWFLDSGCSHHMCGNKERFIQLDLNFSHSVKLGNDTRLNVSGRGQIKLKFQEGTYVIQDVYYVPDLKNNLLSIGQLQQRGLSFLIASNICKIYHPQKGLIMQSHMSANRMFPLVEQTKEMEMETGSGCLYSDTENIAKLWHDRYGHLSYTGMKKLQQKKMVHGLPSFKVDEEVCTDCLIGKQHKASIPRKSNWRASSILELIHSDICGPINPMSNGRKRYVLSFIDDFSRKAWCYLLAEKSEAFECFKIFKRKVETETGSIIKTLRTDRGGEFTSDRFNSFCKEHAIKRQLTNAFTPQQNGVAERKNRTVMNMVRTLLAAKKMTKVLWAEAVMWTFHVLNRSPTKALSNKTPNEAWYGKKPSVEHFRTWGCIAHVHIPKEKRTKLDDKSVTCIFMGISEESKGYRLLNPRTMMVTVSDGVVFEERKSWDWGQTSSRLAEPELTWGDNDDEVVYSDDEVTGNEDDDNLELEENEPQIEAIENQHSVETQNPEASTTSIREGQRQRRPPSYLKDYDTGKQALLVEEVNAIQENVEDPIDYEEASKVSKWRAAMDAEIKAINYNQTWELIELPAGAKCIGVKWVYKTKLNERGEIDKHKARLVAKGYCQRRGIDYAEIYAPVARMDTIRLMLAIAAQRGWFVYQMDVKSAFLHGTLDEEVYVQQPQGYVVKGSEQKVLKLHKALYGLKQAPRAWFSRIESYFLKEGFKNSEKEHTLFIKKDSNGGILIVNLYVDDLIYTGNSMIMLQEFKMSMMNEFEMSDLGKMKFFLGIEVMQSAQGIHISQHKYAIEILKRFEMGSCNAVLNPIVPGSRLVPNEGLIDDPILFKQMVGCLMYITNTRPDIQYVVSLLSRFMSNPNETHVAAAKRVLRYLQGTLDYGIWYKNGGEGLLDIFTDSDFAGDSESRKSTSGYVFLWDKGAVSWSSKKQDIVALSSTEAEYVAAASCACQTMWIKEIMEELDLVFQRSMVIKCDNTSTIKLSKNTVFHGRCKHIGVRFHFLRDLVKNGFIELVHCRTTEQLADLFTKPLGRDTFQKFRARLGVCSKTNLE